MQSAQASQAHLTAIHQRTDEISSSVAEHTAHIQQARTGLGQSIAEVVELLQQSTVDFNPVLSAIQQGRSEAVSLIQQNGTDAERVSTMHQEHHQRVSTMLQQHQNEVATQLQANTVDLAPVMKEIQNSRASMDLQALQIAMRQHGVDVDSSTKAIVQAIHSNKTEVDFAPMLEAVRQNGEAASTIMTRVNALSGENQVNLGRVIEAVDFAPILASIQQSKDPVIEEVRKLKQNFSVKIDLNPILSAIAEIHDQLAASLKQKY